MRSCDTTSNIEFGFGICVHGFLDILVHYIQADGIKFKVNYIIPISFLGWEFWSLFWVDVFLSNDPAISTDPSQALVTETMLGGFLVKIQRDRRVGSVGETQIN